MKAKSPLLLLAALICAVAIWAQEARVLPSRATTPAKPARTKPIEAVDADRAYKANCSRCHVAPRKFSERKEATVMQHMRVRANRTEAETKAILHYLTR